MGIIFIKNIINLIKVIYDFIIKIIDDLIIKIIDDLIRF